LGISILYLLEKNETSIFCLLGRLGGGDAMHRRLFIDLLILSQHIVEQQKQVECYSSLRAVVLLEWSVSVSRRQCRRLEVEGGRRRQKLLHSIKDFHMNAYVRNK
jgi:hypothetical protein